jgi:hypothetical protein
MAPKQGTILSGIPGLHVAVRFRTFLVPRTSIRWIAVGRSRGHQHGRWCPDIHLLQRDLQGLGGTEARAAKGEVLTSKDIYFVIAPTMQTSAKKYDWLNAVQCIGKMVSYKNNSSLSRRRRWQIINIA